MKPWKGLSSHLFENKFSGGGEDPDPDPLPFKNYGVHTIKPQLRPWLHPLIENNITIELNYWLLSAYICNLFHTYHPYLEALSTWSWWNEELCVATFQQQLQVENISQFPVMCSLIEGCCQQWSYRTRVVRHKNEVFTSKVLLSLSWLG
jgi:hypothetical protein